jgi:hypothetical protein
MCYSCFLRSLLLLATCFLPALLFGNEPGQLKGLFIGNSFCDDHVIPNQVAAMIKHSGGDASLVRQTKGGYSWEKHWEAGTAQERIRSGHWDLVVLQNHSKSPIEDRDAFDEYGQKFIDLVKESKAEPILYMTWAPFPELEKTEAIAEAYSTLGERNGVKVAPVGLAFKAWIDSHPDVPLHIEKDRKHATMAGGYLSACTLYATITGKDPSGMPHVIEGYNWATKGNILVDIPPDLARELQATAWETVKGYNRRKHAAVPSDN